MPKYSVMIARFPYGGYELTECVDWLVGTVIEMKGDARVGEILRKKIGDTPITMTRNDVCRAAQKAGADFILMLDNDVAPDHHLNLPGAKPFWASSWEFLLNNHSPENPAIVAAPYCGPPPSENVYVFRWRNRRSRVAHAEFQLEQFTREEAAERTGIEEVAALPTGLLLMHTSVLEHAPVPWFEYEYTDRYQTHKATTEDVYFTRNVSTRGVPVYCNWDAWCGHDKRNIVGRPFPATIDLVRSEFAKSRKILGRVDRPRMLDVPPGGALLGT
jgi:hypothetical protein